MNFLLPLLSHTAEYDPEAYNIGLLDGLAVALGGYAVVFAGLIALMVVVIIVGKVFTAKKAAKKEEAPAAAAAPAEVEEEASEPAVAPGTAGELKLHDVSPKTAAMLMAIVADKMGKPLTELRFISIKEVK